MVEHMNRTLWKRDRCMIFNAQLIKDFWAEAIYMACYIVNRAPSTSLDFQTLEEVWLCTTTNYSNLIAFGCTTHMHVNNEKLKFWAKKSTFLGYAFGVKGHILCFLHLKFPKLMISRDVISDIFSILSSKESSSSCGTDDSM